ncbi:hypothetical protein PYCCODRAFT_1379261, partial [Trametes coccinea BRFM310]
VPFGVTYEKIGTIQRRLAWPLHKDDTLSRSGRPTGLNIYFAQLHSSTRRRMSGRSPRLTSPSTAVVSTLRSCFVLLDHDLSALASRLHY